MEGLKCTRFEKKEKMNILPKTTNIQLPEIPNFQVYSKSALLILGFQHRW